MLEIHNTVQTTAEEKYRLYNRVVFAEAAFKIWLQLWESRLIIWQLFPRQHDKFLSEAVQTELCQVLKEVCDPLVVHAEDRFRK